MQGTHTYPVNEPGDYGRPPERPELLALVPKEVGDRMMQWQVCAPDGSSCSLNPKIHSVTEHQDGTITVWPSIVTSTWHGWLTRGVWRSV